MGNWRGQSQFKFVGGSSEEELEKLAGKKFSKYVEAGAKLTVPSDYYDGIKASAGDMIEKLKTQQDHALAKYLGRKIEHTIRYAGICAGVTLPNTNNSKGICKSKSSGRGSRSFYWCEHFRRKLSSSEHIRSNLRRKRFQ